MLRALTFLVFLPLILPAAPDDLRRFDEAPNPYWPGPDAARLATVQWIGEKDVTAAAVLSIDDLGNNVDRYEAFLRPILDRLKKIDGRAPLSIFTTRVDPNHPHLQTWLREGVSIETHTVSHPCPLLQGRDIEAAKANVDQSTDVLFQIPNSQPVAYRMPCCDSQNSNSPRFYSSIFNHTTPEGNFLKANASIFNLPARERERFAKYIPPEWGFVNVLDDYPYPYVVGNLCWELPACVPSDWAAQNHHGSGNPVTITDLKFGLDDAVTKGGVFTLCFHPHGWIQNKQVVELVDHAVTAHGKKLRFLSIPDVVERIEANALGGRSLRSDDGGTDAGIRLVDVNRDRFLDVLVSGELLRLWNAKISAWEESELPFTIDANTRFGHVGGAFAVSTGVAGWQWRAGGWKSMTAPPSEGRFLDLDGKPGSEWVSSTGVFAYEVEAWKRMAPFPEGVPFDDATRFVDLEGDGDQDLVRSDVDGFAVYRNDGGAWKQLRSERRAEHPERAIPAFVREDGSENGAWFREGHLYLQNEDTGRQPMQVTKLALADLARTKGKVLETDALSPADALKAWSVPVGTQLELLVHEPEVKDPIDVAWAADGSLWVVEMADYPNGSKEGGRVRKLKAEGGEWKTRLLIDDLTFPTSVFPWKDGALVLAPPNLWFVGPDKQRERLYSGFGEGNQQHRANGMQWGLDNWVHLANGDSGGTITAHQTGKTLKLGARDLRIHPDTGGLEATTGRCQFGRNRNDWGDWFGNNNSNPIWHVVLPERYLRRNPHVAPPSPIRQLVTGRPAVFPLSTTTERFNDFDHPNRVTSACGSMIYRDTLLEGFADQAFICEPVHNLVHRRVLTRNGTTFAATRAAGEERRDVLASQDNWARPVAMRTAPDGSLTMVDMVRQVIEHPKWIPAEWQAKLDLGTGRDLGRIYRLRPAAGGLREMPDLTTLPIADLVAVLESPNGTQRDLAHQELLRRPEADAASVQVALEARRSAQARVHALAVLDTLGRLSTKHLTAALGSEHPGLRRHAMVLTESRSNEPELLPRTTDGDTPELVLQAAFSLGAWSSDAAGQALLEIARKHGGDPYIRAAVLSSALPHAAALLELGSDSPLFPGLVATVVGEKDPELRAAVVKSLARGDAADWKFAAALPLLKADPSLATAMQNLAKAARTSMSEPAIAFLGGLGDPADLEPIYKLLDANQPLARQRSALKAVSAIGGNDLPTRLLNDWPSLSPELRASTVDVLGSRKRWIASVFDILEAAAEHPARRSPLLRERLRLASPERAATLFAVDPDVQGRINRLVAAFAKDAGNAESGQIHFKTHCAICHRLDEQGTAVGPDLAALTDRSNGALLTAILDPNRAVEDKYTSWLARDKNGNSVTGLLTREAGGAVELTTATGESRTMLRKDLAELRSSGMSLMPAGYEALPKDTLRDLLAYLRPIRAERRTFAGNEPRVLRSEDDGKIVLPASAASIYGTRIVWEKKYGNLGYWSETSDYAVWEFEVPKAGRYTVQVDYACPGDMAGHRLLLRCGERELEFEVKTTGSWDSYKTRPSGAITLPAGRHRMTAQPGKGLERYLMDLRSVRLIPAK